MSDIIFTITQIDEGVKVIPYQDINRITWCQALALFQVSPSFINSIVDIMRKNPFQSYFWECSPVRLNDPFEFVLINAPELLKLRPDISSFRAQISQQSVTVFPNLNKDAYLVVPSQISPVENYTHIANFIRGAPPEQIWKLFRLIGLTGSELAKILPIFWLSTSGLGVSWLHVRLDLAPKYYSYQEYR